MVEYKKPMTLLECVDAEYIQLYDGDGLEISRESKEFNFKCCDCGHIHKVKIEHKKDSIVLRFTNILECISRTK